MKSASKLRRSLRLVYWVLLLALPVSTFFSYYPIISLGSNSSMNFEISLPLILLVIFDLVAFANLVLTGKGRNPLGSARSPLSDRRFFLFSLFPLYATLSIFWSANPLRAILTAGIIWLLFFAVFAILYISPLLDPPAKIRRYFLITFFATTFFVCLFCFLQSILDICGLPRELTLLCPGCTYRSFGFPHPSGFAIEPQFMGNLLLAPTLIALYLLIREYPEPTGRKTSARQGCNRVFLRGSGLKNAHVGAEDNPTREHPEVTTEGETREARNDGTERRRFPSRVIFCILAFLFSTTLFFTLSRGAIYAYIIALVVLFIFTLARKLFRPALVIVPVASFLLALCLQGTFAQAGPTSETFLSAIAKSVHQLSLGVVDLRSFASPSSLEALEDPSSLEPSSYEALPKSSLESPLVASSGELNASEDTYFDGYVAESTNVRLSLNGAAIDTWLSAPGHPASDLMIGLKCAASSPCTAVTPLTPTSILFGVGLGGAGTALYLNSFITGIHSPKEIVQNEPLSLLLELGLVGVVLVVFSLLIAFTPQLFSAKFLDGRAASVKPAKPVSKSAKASNLSNFPKPARPLLYRSPALPLLLSLIIAYFITLQFFSGLPNALHIYLIPPLLYYLFVASRAEP